MRIHNIIAVFIAMCGSLYGANSTMAGDKDLYETVIRGDVAAIQQLLDAGANVNTSNVLGWTLLHQAAMNGHKEMTRFLIGVGADLGSLSRNGCSALELAIITHKMDIAEMLVNAGASLQDCERFRGKSVFRFKPKTAEEAVGYIDRYSNGNANTGKNRRDDLTALHRVAQDGLVSGITLLLRSGVDVNVPCTRGLSALDYAAGKQHWEVAEVLCERGADLPQLTIEILHEQDLLGQCQKRANAWLKAVNEWRNELKRNLPNDIVESCILPLSVTQPQLEKLQTKRANSATD